MTPSALKSFGAEVRKARTAKGWTLAVLAQEVYDNPDRKSYLSGVENGKKRLSALTIQRISKALELPQGAVDRALGVSADKDDDQTLTERNAELLLQQLEETRERLKISEALAVALAYDYAQGNPTDLESALGELRSVFELAAAQRGKEHDSTTAQENLILNEVDRLNDSGATKEASRYLKQSIDEEISRLEQNQKSTCALIRAGIEQAVFKRDIGQVVELTIKEARIEQPNNAFDHIKASLEGWRRRGERFGLSMNLEVAQQLAVHLKSDSNTVSELTTAHNLLGMCLATIGEWRNDLDILQEAIREFESALELGDRGQDDIGVGKIRNNLGGALLYFGSSIEDIDVLQRSLEECQNAERLFGRAGSKDNELSAMLNQANSLSQIGYMEASIMKLGRAVTLYKSVLESVSHLDRNEQYIDIQINLCSAYVDIGEIEGGTRAYELASSCAQEALNNLAEPQESLTSAILQFNLAQAEIGILNVVGEFRLAYATLERLQNCVAAFEAAGATQYQIRAEKEVAKLREHQSKLT